MSKLNKSLAAKKARASRQYYNGEINPNGAYQSNYSAGRDAYISRVPYSDAWHPHKKQGWKAQRDSDIRLLNQCSTQAVKDSIANRLLECMGVAA